jgi:hypothetical protein
MLLETPSVKQLSRIIGSVAAPALLLGAVAAFISVLISRMNRVIDRSQFLHGIGDADAALLNRAAFYATLSAITTALLIIAAFILALLRVTHECGVAILFMVAVGFSAFRSSTWHGRL